VNVAARLNSDGAVAITISDGENWWRVWAPEESEIDHAINVLVDWVRPTELSRSEIELAALQAIEGVTA
jgi:hypothetical protein